MNDLRKMLEEFKNKYIYIQADEHLAIVHGDNELIYRILNGMMNHIETIELQNSEAKIVEDEK